MHVNITKPLLCVIGKRIILVRVNQSSAIARLNGKASQLRRKVLKLVTSGCSFTDKIAYPENWSVQLERSLDVEHVALGFISQGNGLISRKLIHYLSTVDDVSDILVGVMWSGPDRHDLYIEDGKSDDKVLSRPGHGLNDMVDDDDIGAWYPINLNRKDKFATTYFKHYHSEIGCRIITYEHILRTQWYLEKRNIKYFMMAYTSNPMGMAGDHPQLKYLWDEIDHTNFIKDDHITWLNNNMNYSIKRKKLDYLSHPEPLDSIAYTEKVILPFLRDKGLIE